MHDALSPTELVVLQGTPFCNLNCTYCDLSAASRKLRLVMQPDLIDRIFTELFTSGRLADEVMIVWHSGEPLTLPPDYYDQAIGRIEALRLRLAPSDLRVIYDIQTNGVLINADWCDLFRRHAHHLKIGVSCDGPAALHDSHRTNWSDRPTHARTLRGMDMLAAAGIPYKVIAVVTERTLADPRAFFDFFNDRRDQLSGFHFNILASADGNRQTLSYASADRTRYQDFYATLLRLAAEAGKDGLVIQNFTQGLQRILHTGALGTPPVIVQTSAPFKALNFDTEGNVTTFYAGLSMETLAEEYGDGKGLSLGNIRDCSLNEMAQSAKLQRMAADFRRSSAHCLKHCDYAGVCSGGFEITKRLVLGDFAASETPECVVHVMALTDALLDDLDSHMAAHTAQEVVAATCDGTSGAVPGAVNEHAG